jgi:hypothetical protein
MLLEMLGLFWNRKADDSMRAHALTFKYRKAAAE